MTDVALPDSVKGTVIGVFTKPLGNGHVAPRQGWVDIYPNVEQEGQRLTVASLGYAITASRTRITLDVSTGSIGTLGLLSSYAPGMAPGYIQWVCETHFSDHGGNFIMYFDVPLGATVDVSSAASSTSALIARDAPVRVFDELPVGGYPGIKEGHLIQVANVIYQIGVDSR